MYVYGMRLRPFGIGCQPIKLLQEVREDETGRYWGILVYKEKLSDKQVRDYELDYLGEEKEQ